MTNVEALMSKEVRMSNVRMTNGLVLRLLTLAAILSAVPSSVFAAAPEASSLFPAGGQVGQEVTVTVGGNVKPWPVTVWSDDPKLVVAADKKEGTVTIKIGAEVEPGVHWLRFSNSDGASPPRPFVVGTLAEIAEKEPNNDLAASQSLAQLPVTVNGKLGTAGDIDTFVVELKQGQTLVADVKADRPLGSPVDMIMQLADPTGFVLAQNNDDVGLDPRITFTAARTGPHHVRVYGYSSTPSSSIGFGGGENFIYRLTVTTGPLVDFAYPIAIQRGANRSALLCGPNVTDAIRNLKWPTVGKEPLLLTSAKQAAGAAEVRVVEQPTSIEQEPNDLNKPQAVTLPVVLSGRCDQPEDVDVFVFEAKKNQRFVAKVEARSLGFPTDPVLMLYDDQGMLIQTLDDAAQNRDCELAVAIRADGKYRLVMRDLYRAGSPRHAYLLSLSIDEPDFGLTLGATEYTLAKGKTLEIPVTIERRGGFAGEIELTVRGLPEGVKVEANKSAAKGDTAKSVKLKLSGATKPFSGPLEIVGRSVGDNPRERTATIPLANRIAAWSQVWLTVTK